MKTGLFYAGRSDLQVSDLKRVDADVSQFGDPLNAEVYEFKNEKGETVKIASAPCRDGFDLWLIAPNGFAVRT